MSYTTSFNKEDEIIEIRISGSATREEHYAALGDAIQLCQENGCAKLLIDLREMLSTRFTTTRCFTFGRSVADKPPFVRIAHVMPADAKSREDVRFVSTIEANRGIASREFETIDDAKTWLIGKK